MRVSRWVRRRMGFLGSSHGICAPYLLSLARTGMNQSWNVRWDDPRTTWVHYEVTVANGPGPIVRGRRSLRLDDKSYISESFENEDLWRASTKFDIT